MGWPDDHTRWRADGTEVSDSARYRMCGNGVASPVAHYVAACINRALEQEADRG
jgi:site-specific DNA-cytosine methylase